MDFINSLSPARKKDLLAAAILLIIALVTAGFLHLADSSETGMAASAASGAQDAKGDPQSDIPQFVAEAIALQSDGFANESGSLVADIEAIRQVIFVANTLWDAYTDPEQARATDLSFVLTASVLEESDVQALEWTRNGTHATGSPTLEDAHILNDDGVGSVTVSMCVDSSNVRVLNDAGTALADDTTVTCAPTYFLLMKDGGVRKLSSSPSLDSPAR